MFKKVFEQTASIQKDVSALQRQNNKSTAVGGAVFKEPYLEAIDHSAVNDNGGKRKQT